MNRKFPEIFTGLAVIVIAAVFLLYALDRAQALGSGGYPLTAQFSDIGGLTTGSDVKIGGVVVGQVTDEHLDPQTFAAVVRLKINNNIQLPNDTSATIASDGLLGGNYIALSPGGSATNLAPGQAFTVTQSAVNIEDLLGKFIFNMGGSASKPAGGQSGGQPSGGQSNAAALPGTK
jgi:phospholipid/cholesterol/gamma-HCH transport system substrate-binding protein